MKFLFTSIIALFLLGLCLMEKESKRRALGKPNIHADLPNNLSNVNRRQDARQTFTGLAISKNDISTEKHLQNSSVTDSIFRSFEPLTLNDTPLLNAEN